MREAISLEGFARTAFFLNGLLGPTVSANGPLWSLAYEVWFYIGAALLFLGLTGKRLAWLGLALYPVFVIADPWFAVWGACWLGGAAVSVLHASGRLGWARRRWMVAALLLPAAGLAAIMLSPPNLVFWTTRLFQVLFCAWFILHMAQALNEERLVSIKSIVATAGFSYTLYVVHFPMLLVAYGISEAKIAAPIAAITILLFAALTGRWIESIALIRRPAKPVAAPPKPEPAE